MTDPRRATIAALQAKPADLPLLIANAVLCQEYPEWQLQEIALELGLIEDDRPPPTVFGKPMTPISATDLFRKMMDPDSPIIRAQNAALAARKKT